MHITSIKTTGSVVEPMVLHEARDPRCTDTPTCRKHGPRRCETFPAPPRKQVNISCRSSSCQPYLKSADPTGEFAMRRGHFQEAVSAFSTALKAGGNILTDDHKSALYASRAMAYLGAGETKRAGEDASLSVDLDPKSFKARVCPSSRPACARPCQGVD